MFDRCQNLKKCLRERKDVSPNTCDSDYRTFTITNQSFQCSHLYIFECLRAFIFKSKRDILNRIGFYVFHDYGWYCCRMTLTVAVKVKNIEEKNNTNGRQIIFLVLLINAIKKK